MATPEQNKMVRQIKWITTQGESRFIIAQVYFFPDKIGFYINYFLSKLHVFILIYLFSMFRKKYYQSTKQEQLKNALFFK